MCGIAATVGVNTRSATENEGPAGGGGKKIANENEKEERGKRGEKRGSHKRG